MPLLSLFASAALCLATSPRVETVDLDGAWRLTQAERKIAVPAVVPGVVQTDLMRAGRLPDPYFGLNEKAVQWVSDLPWTYSRTFTVTPAFLRHRRIVLRCEGVDTIARIRIDGKEVGRPDNMFRTWEFDAKPFLVAGANTIRVDFETLDRAMKAMRERPPRFGKPVQDNGKQYIRKPPFQGGWDFAPRLLTSGIWRPIRLIGWDEARLTDVGVAQRHLAHRRVDLDVTLTADTETATRAHVAVLFKGREVAHADAPFRGGVAKATAAVSNAQLWWPNEMGPQNLYDVRVELRDAAGRVVDRGARRIGLRTLTWYPKTATRPLTLAVNGRRFFARGSNWVPFDSLLRENPAKERSLIQKAADAHMNLLRLWGGGYYEDDALFDAADEKGVLLWFEFKFADAAYPAFDPEWLENVKAEARDNVRRARNHPCVAVYSGNNEVIGFIADKTTSGNISRQDYDLLFHTTLRDVVHRLAPDAFYTPGSPEIGDDHYWDVWHGSASFASYRDRHGFMSEYGFQSFAVPRTVRQFTTPAGRASVETREMLQHQKNWRDGDALIVGALLRYFRKPKDFDSTLWVSQIDQAQGILTGVEHWRRDWPRSSGSLVWQFNDPWPVTSWSMIDSYGRPKALYYRLKHAYAPVALSGLADARTGRAELWVANDRPWPLRGTLAWTAMRADGTRIASGTQPVAIPAGTSAVRTFARDFAKPVTQPGSDGVLLYATLRTPHEPDSQTTLLFGRPKDIELADPKIRTSVQAAGGGFRVTLSGAHPALWAWVSLDGLDAEFSDNFVDLAPGKAATIFVKPKAKVGLAQFRKALRVRSLFDTYAPGVGANPVVKPLPDGRIVATADEAEMLGDGFILEVGTPSNVGNWQNVGDRLRWTVVGAKPGTYAVAATVAIPANEAGSTFTVSVDGNALSGVVPGTKSWYDYVTIPLGTVRVDAAGYRIELTPKTKVSTHVMNLRAITLTPVP